MSVCERVESLETTLETVSTKIASQYDESRALIGAKQSEILRALIDAGNLIQTDLPQALEFQQSSTDTVANLSAQQIVRRRRTLVLQRQWISAKLLVPFGELETKADSLLLDLMTRQNQAISRETEVDALKKNVRKASTQAQNEIDRLEEEIRTNESEMATVEARLDSITSQLERLGIRKDDARVGQAVTGMAGASFVGVALATGPFALLPAIGFGVSALILRDKKKTIRREEYQARSERDDVQTAITSLREQQSISESAHSIANALPQRCVRLEAQVKSWKKVIAEQIRFYQSLKEAASDFTLWANDVQCDAEMIGSSDNVERFRTSLQKLVKDLSEESREQASNVCPPLLLLQDAPTPW